MKINEALKLWIKLTGQEPDQNSWSEVQGVHAELKESQELDPSMTLTTLLLDVFVTEFITQEQISMLDLLEDFDARMERLGLIKEIYGLIRDPEIEAVKEAFKKRVEDMCLSYEVVKEDTLTMARDMANISLLYRDALKAMEYLRVFQFLQGDLGTAKPKYNKQVYEFWNTNSLIRALAASLDDGISVCLIRDPKMVCSSYFVFALKNGGTLTVVTDKEKSVHPLHKYMTRNPGRHFDRRAFRYHFPYSVMELEFVERKGGYWEPKKDRKDLVVYNTEWAPLRKISELEPDEMIWCGFMFELLKEKFWDQGHQTLELAYTGDMILQPHLLSEAEETKGLVPARYKPLILPPLQLGDVSTETLIEEKQWTDPRSGCEEQDPTQFNERWFFRYQDQISEEPLNVFEDPTQEQSLILHPGVKQSGDLDSFRGFELVEFGTKEEIEHDRKWFARYNLAIEVKKRAEAEIEGAKPRLMAWFRNRVAKNIPALLEAVAHKSFKVSSKIPAQLVEDEEGNEEWDFAPDFGRGLQRLKERERMDFLHPARNSIFLYTGFSLYRNKIRRDLNRQYDFRQREFFWRMDKSCFLTGGPLILGARIRVDCAEEVAAVCGCETAELPELLQMYESDHPHAPYDGNSILERVDPMDWVIGDPFREFNFDIHIWLSKRGYLRLCKKHGTAPDKVWLHHDTWTRSNEEWHGV